MNALTKQRLISLSLEAAYYVVLFGALWFLAKNRHAPLRPLFWHTVQKACQRTAYRVGRVGIYAEKAYGVAMEKVKL